MILIEAISDAQGMVSSRSSTGTTVNFILADTDSMVSTMDGTTFRGLTRMSTMWAGSWTQHCGIMPAKKAETLDLGWKVTMPDGWNWTLCWGTGISRTIPSIGPSNECIEATQNTGMEEVDEDVACFRLRILFKIMHHSVAYGRRVRVQILAFGVEPGVNVTDAYLQRRGVTTSTVIPEDGLLIEPIAVRAPSGHTKHTGWHEVRLRKDPDPCCAPKIGSTCGRSKNWISCIQKNMARKCASRKCKLLALVLSWQIWHESVQVGNASCLP